MSTSSSPSTAVSKRTANDPLRLVDVDYVRFYVGNAKQAAYFYAQAFGFEIEQISDLTTGQRESATYLLTQGNIRFLLTTGLSQDHEAQKEVARWHRGRRVGIPPTRPVSSMRPCKNCEHVNPVKKTCGTFWVVPT